jgi:hypothetical protein
LDIARNRLLALIAACALIAAAAAYSAHGLADRGHEHTHCDLCVHLGGSAGSPVPPAVAGKPVLVVRELPPPRQIPRSTRLAPGEHLPRGPPLLDLPV